MKDLFIGFCLGGVSFLIGLYVGAELYRRLVLKRMKMIIPVMQNAVVNVVSKAMREGITEEEMVRVAQEELDFMKIVTDNS